MEKLIPVVNKLQDAFASMGHASPIDLPQIAVVGGQSAGKSSVLENFVGKDFLPRGAGIVTRRPLVLQLINQPGPEYGEFLHKQNRKYMDFLQIRAEIEAETDRVTGSNKNISPMPINLRIFSPHVLNLTIVDLPGLTKVPVGDQPKDIDQQIRRMVSDFISNPNSLILAVTPANIDLANSDALLLAREVDPQGLRTIGVITKIDLMDRGTNCRDVLMNITYPLKRGYVGVVNRSQADIDTRKNIIDAQQAEYSFFVGHPAYRDIASKCGTEHLQNVLNKQLTEHIRTTLPALKKKLLEQMLSLEAEVKSFSDDLDTPAGRARQLMTLLQEFSQEMDQNLGFRISYVQTDHLSFGSKINKILTERFPYEIKKLKGSIDQTRAEIALSIQNTQGVRNTIFTPEAAFITICRKKIQEMRPISLLIIDKVGEIMSEIIDFASVTKIGAFVTLQDELKMTCTRILNEFISEAKSQASKLIDYEYCHINTRHPDFVDAQELPNNEDDKNMVVMNAESNTVYRKGYLNLPSTGLLKNNKELWFVIRGEMLYCYKDETERDTKFTLSLNDLKTRPLKKNAFLLMTQDGKAINKDLKFLELYASSEEECEDWKATLMARGVFPDQAKPKKSKKYDNTSDGQSGQDVEVSLFECKDPQFFKQVELIRTLVDSYMKIVIKNQIDIISKMIVYLVVEKMCTYVKADLIAHVYSIPNNERLLDISESEKKRKEECLKIYKSCKQAMEIINEVMNNNMSTFKDDSPAQTSYRTVSMQNTVNSMSSSNPFGSNSNIMASSTNNNQGIMSNSNSPTMMNSNNASSFGLSYGNPTSAYTSQPQSGTSYSMNKPNSHLMDDNLIGLGNMNISESNFTRTVSTSIPKNQNQMDPFAIPSGYGSPNSTLSLNQVSPANTASRPAPLAKRVPPRPRQP